MDIFLLRHGRAENISMIHTHDHMRPLTQDGAEELGHAAPAMFRAMAPIDRIFTSPLLRARQTAEIIANVDESAPLPIVDEHLDGSYSPETIMNPFSQLGNARSILLVGHVPNVDGLINYLVAPEEGRSFTKMRPGSLARIEVEMPLKSKGTLHWMIPVQVWQG